MKNGIPPRRARFHGDQRGLDTLGGEMKLPDIEGNVLEGLRHHFDQSKR